MNRMKGVLDYKGIKQTCLAERPRKSYYNVNQYVRKRQMLKLEILMEIENILDIDVSELIISNMHQNHE